MKMKHDKQVPPTAVEFTAKPVDEIAREYFPDASEDFLEAMIWGETGYPYYWRIGIDGRNAVECFRMQLARAAARENFGFFGYRDSEWFMSQHFGGV